MEKKVIREKDCIGQELRDVQSKNLLLISQRKMGRTKILYDLLPFLRSQQVGGYYTEEIFEGTRPIALMAYNVNGLESRLLGRTGFASAQNIGSFRIDAAAVEEFLNPTIEKAIQTAGIVVLDQLAEIENASKSFRELVWAAFDSNARVLATLANAMTKSLRDLRGRDDVMFGQVTRENEREWPAAIISAFTQSSAQAAAA